MMKKVIAITGGIGSGKSAVLAILRGKGYFVISADDVNRELLADSTYLDILRMNFAEAFASGVFDKKVLASIIFGDENKRLLLNSIAHERIRALVNSRITDARTDIVFVEVPLLIESGMIDMFDAIIVVTADMECKVERVMARDGCSREEVLSRMNCQLADDELIKIATYVIENNDSISSLEEDVDIVLRKIHSI